MRNLLYQFLVLVGMILFVYLGYLSLSGGADWSGQQDPCDGSSRSVCP